MTSAFLDRLADGVVAAVADGTDLVLTAYGPASLSQAAGEAFAVPVIGTYPAPAFATREFPLPGVPDADGPGPHGNLAGGRALLARAGMLQEGVLGRLRSRLGLPAAVGPVQVGRIRPVFHGFSRQVVPRPADWPSEVEVSGYWWPARPRGWRPPAELVDFLQAGPPPVFFGFGSMAPSRGDRLGELVAVAVARAGVRAVVQAGWAGLSAVGDDVLAIGDLPHDWLFPRTAAVVHHAGAGTTAAGLRAGVPAVPVPVMADQPFWAARLHRSGVAPRPLPFHELTTEALAEAITPAWPNRPTGSERSNSHAVSPQRTAPPRYSPTSPLRPTDDTENAATGIQGYFEHRYQHSPANESTGLTPPSRPRPVIPSAGNGQLAPWHNRLMPMPW
ncbi:glycosyltransferase [Streptomyces lasalocidi]